ncbi:MAG: cytochrome c oxidase assembly protein [Caldilinea sp.]
MNILSILAGLLLIVVTLLYFRGWMRLRRRGVSFANLPRLVVFLFAVTLTAFVFLSPLNWLNQEYFFIRVAQYVMLCLFAIPAFFISCAFDVMLWGLPAGWRRSIGRWMRSEGLVRRGVHSATRPWLAIMLFIAIFVAWHDNRIAGWLLADSLLHTTSLLLLGAAAMLVWWHFIGTGPRLHTELSPWLAAIALLIIELTSMSIAVPTAFSTQPLYAHYAAVFMTPNRLFPLTIVDDQALGGGLIWVAGSAVYLSSIVLILNRLFDRHGMDGADPLPNWDDDDRMIMPGLEHRVKK